MTGTDLAAASAIGNVGAVAAIIGLGFLVVRQARRIARLNVKIHEQHEAGVRQTLELGEALADNDQLTADLQDLRDENVSLLRSLFSGEAS